jgi:NAD(P)-dependent dehydrogenase (short-subunit alcohol dehydrogenase family)
MEMRLLEGKVALVTGATSGIGKAVAIGFAEHGATVIVAGRREAEGRAVVETIRAAGGTADFVGVDVSNADQVERLISRGAALFGEINIAFNNAGIGSSSPRLADLNLDDFDRIFNTNVKGTFSCLKFEISQMLKQGKGGAIINTTSIEAHSALGGSSIYTASKHAILGFTKAAAVDYARDNIRINALSPGMVVTPLAEAWGGETTDIPAVLRRIPMGAFGMPEDMVGSAVFLASDLSRYTTGSVVTADGGYLAH